MRQKLLAATLLSAACFFAHLSGTASAQSRCLEGKTANGQCVDPGLADTMRQTAVVFSQQKLSYTAYPILPTGDRTYRYPNELIPDQLKPSAIGVIGVIGVIGSSSPGIGVIDSSSSGKCVSISGIC